MISFDIFDTLITRATAKPDGIFAIIQNILCFDIAYEDIPEYIRMNYYTLRIHAEELARYHNRSKGIEEITIRDIYDALAMAGGLIEEQIEQLISLECETELKNVLPISKNIGLLKEKLAVGERVILISDMYLPENVIRGMLESVDNIFRDVTIYVSSELMARKTSGNIYRKIKEIENIKYWQWIHYGDDMQQDIERAESLGITGIYLKRQELSCCEKLFMESQSENLKFQLMAGQAKYVRMNYGGDIPYDIGASICGPLIYEYANWIVIESQMKGIRRLYFIARDGYLVKVAADKIIKARKLNIETKYIYGSRKAWRMCSLTVENFNFVQMLRWSYIQESYTLKEFADILELDCEELFPFLPYSCRRWPAELSQQGLYRIASELENDWKFREFYVDRQAEKRKRVSGYLLQELDVSDDAFAFVDVSGGGLTQGCLKNIMTDFYEKPIKTFFFKLDRVNLCKGCIYYVFFPSAIKNNLVIEMICRAPHGQTIDYAIEGEKVVPVLDGVEEKGVKKKGFARLQKGMTDYIDSFLALKNDAVDLPSEVSIIKRYLIYVAEMPDREVLEYFSACPNNENGRQTEVTEYAPKLSREDILNIFVRRMPWEPLRNYYRGTDLSYSVLRCSDEDKELIDKCRREYNAGWAKHERIEKIRREEAVIRKYGNAAYYPCELLEEKIVLYGAGKLGEGLHDKIVDLGISTIVKWVDKKADKVLRAGNIEFPETIKDVEYDQVVIAVVDSNVAVQIKEELIEMGITEKKIFWIQVYQNKYARAKWE